MKKGSVKLILTLVLFIFMLIITSMGAFLYTVNNYLEAKKTTVPIFVFLKSDCTNLQAIDFYYSLKKNNKVKDVKLIDKNEALRDILSKLDIHQQFSENPLPYSLEIFLKSSAISSLSDIEAIERQLRSNKIVDEVKVPKGLFANISNIHFTYLEFATSLIVLFVIIEFIILAVLLKIIYQYNKSDYDKLKLFGVNRFRIFLNFLSKNLGSFLISIVLACIFVFLEGFFYIKYVNLLPEYNTTIVYALIVGSIANFLVSLIFVIFLSTFLFVIEDEKI